MTKLKVTCKAIKDFNGEWDQKGIEEDMQFLGLPTNSPEAWIEYVLSHLFVRRTMSKRAFDAALDPDVQSVVFKLDSIYTVKVEKFKG